MKVSVDIETSCNKSSCQHYKQSGPPCGHALYPRTAAIDIIGVVTSSGQEAVFSELSQFQEWLLKNRASNLELGGHNFVFDLSHLQENGLDLLQYGTWSWDSRLEAYLSRDKIPADWLYRYEQARPKQVRRGSPHSLKTLAPYFLQVDPYWEVSDKHDADYVLKDARYALALSDLFQGKLKQEGSFTFYQQHLLPWSDMLLKATMGGVAVNQEAMENLDVELETEQDEAEAYLRDSWHEAQVQYTEQAVKKLQMKYAHMALTRLGKTSPITIEAVGSRLMTYSQLYLKAKAKQDTTLNLNSSTQIKWLLQDYLHLDITNEDDEVTTGISTLEQLAASGRDDISVFIKWRKSGKLRQYIEQYRNFLDSTGRLHPTYHVTGTRTGRLSASEPNLQQVNKRLKPVFQAPEGFQLVGFDLSSIETALIALYTHDNNLYQIFKSGESPHNRNVKVFFGFEDDEAEIPEKYPLHRQATKNVGFALFYGAGAQRIKQTFLSKGFIFTDEECWQMLTNYRKEYQAVFDFHKHITAYLERGGVLENLFGRPLYIERSNAYMTGFNTLIQSSASDLCLVGAQRAFAEATRLSIAAQPALFIHDYVGFYVPEDDANKFADILKTAMTSFQLRCEHGPIQLRVEGGSSTEWR